MAPRAPLQRLSFNGVDGKNGGPAFCRPTVDEFLESARGKRLEKGAREVVMRRFRDANESHLDFEDGVNPCLIEEAGWGVIFPRKTDPVIREALEPLLRWREEHAKARDERLFKVYADRRIGCGSREILSRFLERRGASDGPVRPTRMPYYLMLVGGPDEIPFEFQYQLDVRYAVGRICFRTPEEYATYAQNVVAAERQDKAKGAPLRRQRAALFAPSEEGEEVEQWMVEDLARPLSRALKRSHAQTFQVEAIFNQDATRQRLLKLLGQDAPALLFTACHGLVYEDHPEYRDHQGALLCHGHHQKSEPRHFAVGASDLTEPAGGAGRITMHFGCFSAGVPVWDGLERRPDGSPRLFAKAPFATALPQQLLAQPGGSTLAVVAHVGRAWTYSFASEMGSRRLAPFEQCLKRLLSGNPVGHALEPFNMRHAALSAEWLGFLQKEQLEPWAKPRASDMVDTFCTWLDSRSFVVLGDPAVRLPIF